MPAEWSRADFDATVDALRHSGLPDLEPTPVDWRNQLRDGSDASAYRSWIGQCIGPFDAERPSRGHGQEDIARHLHLIGTAVIAQWDRTHDRRALRIAIGMWREIAGHAWLTDLVSSIGALAARFLQRYHETADSPLLDAAVYLGRDAVSDPQAFQPSRPGRLLVLADALRCRYEHTGNRADLVEAIARYQEARTWSDGLVAALAHQRELMGDQSPTPAAISAAISTAMPVVASGGPIADAAVRAGEAAGLLAEYPRRGDSTKLDAAIRAARIAVDLTPADHRDLPARLALLGEGLHLAYRRRRVVSLVDDSIAAYRLALTSPIDRMAMRTRVLIGLAGALRTRHDADGGRPEHLAEARLLAGELSAQYPPGHPDRDEVLAELGDLLGAPDRATVAEQDPRRAARLFDLATSLSASDQAGAMAAFADAARDPDAPLPLRGLAGRQWARLAAERGDLREAAEAYELSIDLLPGLVSAVEQRDDQEYQLLPFAGLASDAAACALRSGADPSEALNLLERGRCVLFSHTLGERPMRVDDVVRPLVTADGPVVVVNVSGFGSDALVLTEHDTRVVPLPALTPDAVDDHRIALDAAHDLLRAPAADRELVWAAGRYVTSLLTWLWDSVAGPVLDTLGFAPGKGHLPRMWWSPTGALSLLPLHAAGYHRARDGNTVMDRAVTSCTPTLHHLLRARRSRTGGEPGDRALVVAIDDLPGRELPAAATEAEVVATHLPDARILRGAAADPETVRCGIAGASWVHIACHAATDLADPSASRLILTGGDLTVLDIGRLRIADAYLAYLSACGTARGSDALSDEVIHISSAFQLAGFPHVIGTLWPIADDVAARIAADVYPGLRFRADPARCLHAAVRRLRDDYAGNSPLHWASHVHVGP